MSSSASGSEKQEEANNTSGQQKEEGRVEEFITEPVRLIQRARGGKDDERAAPN